MLGVAKLRAKPKKIQVFTKYFPLKKSDSQEITHVVTTLRMVSVGGRFCVPRAESQPGGTFLFTYSFVPPQRGGESGSAGFKGAFVSAASCFSRVSSGEEER